MFALLFLIAQTGGIAIIPPAPLDSTPFVVRIEVKGLKADTEYKCGVWVYGKPAAISQVWTEDGWKGGYRYIPFVADTGGIWNSYRVLRIAKKPEGDYDYYIKCTIKDSDKNKLIEHKTTHSEGFELMEDAGFIEGIVYSDSSIKKPLEKVLIFAKDGKGKVVGGYISEKNSVDEDYKRKKGYFRMSVPEGKVSSIMIMDNKGVIEEIRGEWEAISGETLDLGSIFPDNIKTESP